MLLDYIDIATPYQLERAHFSAKAHKPLHQHPNVWELAIVVRGHGVKTIGGHAIPFAAGDATLLPPGSPHRWAFDESDTDDGGKVSTIVVFIRDDWFHAVAGLTPSFWKTLAPLFETRDSILLNGTDRARLNALLRRAEGEPEAIRALRLIEALHLFACAANAQHVQHAKQQTEDEREVDQMRTYILNNYMRPLTLEQVARDTGTSRSTFCARFKERMGTTFVDYVNGVRIQRACSLLSRTPLSVTEIASSVGFSDLAYFNRQFRRRMNMSPSDWRRGGKAVKIKEPPVA